MKNVPAPASALLYTTLMLLAFLCGPASGTTKRNIAVITLRNTSGITAGEAELITDRLGSELFSTGRVNVMERDKMDDILKEQGFQQSGACTDEACLVEMGQLLGVQGLISGSIGKLGAMFMINIREIDVGTGAVLRVVSEDVRGEIEDLAGRLRTIAKRLVGDVAPDDVPPPPPPLPEVDVVTETAEALPPKTVPPAAPLAQEDDPAARRNRNRAGIRVGYTTFPGNARLRMKYDFNGSYYNGDPSFDTTVTLETTHLRRLQLLFLIRAGQLFTVSIGPSYSWSESAYENNEHSNQERYHILSLEPGFNFSRRWHPFKVNAGIFADLSMLMVSYEEEAYYDAYNRYDSTSSLLDVGFGAGLGVKVGAEVLLGTPHAGFSLDMIIRALSFSNAFGDGPLADWHDMGHTFGFRFPPIGVGAAFNFYF